MTKLKWAPFPLANKGFDYAGDKLAKAWDKLHAGDQEPAPDEARVAKLVKSGAKLPKGSTPAKAAETLADAWRAFHRGDFAEAHELGASLDALGATVACKAMGIHATYLVDDAGDKLKRFEAVAERAEAASKLLPSEANAHYFRAFALGRYSQGISIAKALAAGLAGKVRESLERTLKLAPKHAEAHLAMALYHAEIVGKVGGMLASLTYGAKAGTAEEHLKTAAKLTPDAPIVYVERANAMLLLHGEAREDDAAALYAKAAKLEPNDAMSALDAAFAKDQIA
jgi:tetratricopeptide (TPR) repeat protein